MRRQKPNGTPQIRDLLDTILVAVENHHIEWYDATEGTVPIEPLDKKLWDTAKEVRDALEGNDDRLRG